MLKKRSTPVFACLFFLLSIPSYAEEFSLELSEKNDSLFKSVQEKNSVRNFLNDIENRLPNKLREKIGKKVTIKFKKLNSGIQLNPPQCLENFLEKPSEKSAASEPSFRPQTFGKVASKHKLHLNELFIPIISAGPERATRYSCGHGNMYQLAVATVIHELGHLYDGIEEVSSQPFYRRMAGWKKSTILRRLYPKNKSILRSPDPYEFKNIKEHFAVNLEYFILDNKFSCRRPAEQQFFSDLFEMPNFHECEMNTQVQLQTLNPDAPNREVDLNPDRIYGVDYFPALPSTGDVSSRWGHAMFRLIVCGPNHPVPVPECRNDVKYHVVLSHRADVDNILSTTWLGRWNALVGNYASKIYLFSLQDVLENYTQLEFRDIQSMPIALTTDEKKGFVYEVLEQYWGYQGQYFFITNNCNTESVDLLKSSVNRESMDKFSPFTPLRLRDSLAKLELLNKDVLKDEKKAVQEGFLFKSAIGDLEAASQIIFDKFMEMNPGAQFPWSNLETYLGNTSVEERRKFFSGFDANKRVYAAFAVLESWIQLRKKQMHRDQMSIRVSQLGREDKMYQLFVLLSQKLISNNSLKRGYGIPTEGDFEPQMEAPAKQDLSEEDRKKISNWIEKEFQANLAELNGITENKKLLRDKIRAHVPAAPTLLAPQVLK